MPYALSVRRGAQTVPLTAHYFAEGSLGETWQALSMGNAIAE